MRQEALTSVPSVNAPRDLETIAVLNPGAGDDTSQSHEPERVIELAP
jgi:hypothetical protein